MSSLNGLNGRYERLENAVPSPPVSPLDDIRFLFTYVNNQDLEAWRSSSGEQKEEILSRARQRYKDGLPPFSYNGFAFPER